MDIWSRPLPWWTFTTACAIAGLLEIAPTSWPLGAMFMLSLATTLGLLFTRLDARALAIALGLSVASWMTWWSVPPKLLTPPEGEVQVEVEITGAVRNTRSAHIVLAKSSRGRLRLLVDRALLPGSRDLLPGSRWAITGRWRQGRPTRFAWERDRAWLARQRGLQGTLQALETPTWRGRVADPWSALSASLISRRLWLEDTLMARHGVDRAAWVASLTLGSRGLLDPEQARPFEITGTAHLLAISGLHLGALAGLLWGVLGLLLRRPLGLLRRFGRRRLSAPIVLACLGGYVLGIGAPVSAMRALAMLAIASVAIGLGRRMCPVHALCMALLCLLGFDPTLIMTPGLQLSVAATLGILLYTRRGRARSKLVQGVGVSLSASLATAPLLWELTGEIPIAGFLLNLLVVPVVSALIFPVAALGVALTPWLPIIADPLVRASAMALGALATILDAASTAPGAVLRPGLATPSLTALACVGVALSLDRRPVGAWLLAICLGWPGWERARALEHMTIAALPVGQGDATLLTWPEGQTWLVDGGGARMGRDPGYHVVMAHLRRQGIYRLDVAVVTHPDLDHIEGMFAVVRYARPRVLWLDVGEDPRAAQLAALAMSVGVDVRRPRRVQTPRPGARIRRPPPSPRPNDQSLIVEVEHAGVRALMTGDLEATGESWLVRDIRPATIYKLGHHGSKTSSTAALLDALRPVVAIASCGRRNPHGHPHPMVTTRLARRGIDLTRTDLQGLIEIAISPDGIITTRTTHP